MQYNLGGRYIPKRYFVVFLMSVGFTIAQFLRANLSIAIIGMTSNRTIKTGNETFLMVSRTKGSVFVLLKCKFISFLKECTLMMLINDVLFFTECRIRLELGGERFGFGCLLLGPPFYRSRFNICGQN